MISGNRPCHGISDDQEQSPASVTYPIKTFGDTAKAALAVAVCCFLLAGSSLCAQPEHEPLPDSPAIEARVDSLLHKLSLEEKLSLLGGEDTFYTRAVPSIGLPRLKMSDGPVGVRTWGPSTAYPSAIAMAATWDPALVHRIGESLGNDARSLGVNILLAPGVNMYRAPMSSRNMEYFGEDPYLSSRMAVAFIQGVQSKGVVATVKHFAGNDSEYDRNHLDSVIDERTLHEIYLPAFEAAVTEAHVDAIMDGYNLANGMQMTENRPLNIDLLKQSWNFQGILMSDWGATHHGLAAAKAGLDLEMPRAENMTPQTLSAALQSGVLSQADIDDKVRRLLRIAVRYGFFDNQQLDVSVPRYNPENNMIAFQAALESITLLKNDRKLLPLDPAKVRTVAIIGPDAFPASVGGGGSSATMPFKAPNLVTEIADYLGPRVQTLYAPGNVPLDEILKSTRFQSITKNPAEDANDAPSNPLDHWDSDYNSMPVEGKVQRTIRWTATYIPKRDAEYQFIAMAETKDSITIHIDGVKALDRESVNRPAIPLVMKKQLQHDKPVKLEIELKTDSTKPRFGFGIRATDELLSKETHEIAQRADVVILAVGFNPQLEGEGFDRTFELPWGQSDLIRQISQLNPATIVSIAAGGAVDASSWIDHVSALLHNWYPGQAGATALTQILFGVYAPEGRLPMSWERTFADNPTAMHYYPEAGANHPTVHYTEGLLVGYRYYTSRNKQPLFSFGYGLTYTSFTMGDLTVSPAHDSSDNMISVSFEVRNSGEHPGAEVAQVYVGNPTARVERPAKELKAFQKVRLGPGERQHVECLLNKRALSYYDPKIHSWRFDPGRFTIYVGDSAEHTPLAKDIVLSQEAK